VWSPGPSSSSRAPAAKILPLTSDLANSPASHPDANSSRVPIVRTDSTAPHPAQFTLLRVLPVAGIGFADSAAAPETLVSGRCIATSARRYVAAPLGKRPTDDQRDTGEIAERDCHSHSHPRRRFEVFHGIEN